MNPTAVIKLKTGETMNIELYLDKTPNTVSNFIYLCYEKYYDGLIFHRVVKDYMIQSGAKNGCCDGNKPGFGIKGEFSSNGFATDLTHERGTISMARNKDFDSASTQFFIVHQNSEKLNGKFAAFGKIIDEESFCVLDKIANTQTEPPEKENRPLTPQIIESITIILNGCNVEKPIRAKTE